MAAQNPVISNERPHQVPPSPELHPDSRAAALRRRAADAGAPAINAARLGNVHAPAACVTARSHGAAAVLPPAAATRLCTGQLWRADAAAHGRCARRAPRAHPRRPALRVRPSRRRRLAQACRRRRRRSSSNTVCTCALLMHGSHSAGMFMGQPPPPFRMQ